jgi:adenylate cyclase class 2
MDNPYESGQGKCMHFEVEQKVRLVDAVELIARVAKLGGAFGEPIEQVDLYFNHPSRDFAATDEACRIRRVGERAFVTYKGPKLDAATKTRRELELPLAAGTAEGFAELLAALGFRRTAEVRKLRRTAEVECQGRSFEVALDDVADVGLFAELETSAAEAELPAARAALAELAAKLELTANERRSYLELLLAGR